MSQLHHLQPTYLPNTPTPRTKAGRWSYTGVWLGDERLYCGQLHSTESKHHGSNPTKYNQRDVVVQEGRHHAIPDMVMLPIGVEACGGA